MLQKNTLRDLNDIIESNPLFENVPDIQPATCVSIELPISLVVLAHANHIKAPLPKLMLTIPLPKRFRRSTYGAMPLLGQYRFMIAWHARNRPSCPLWCPSDDGAGGGVNNVACVLDMGTPSWSTSTWSVNEWQFIMVMQLRYIVAAHCSENVLCDCDELPLVCTPCAYAP